MTCDKCGKPKDELPWYHVSYNGTLQDFCSRICLIESIAPELNNAVFVGQWMPTEEEKERMSK